MSILTFILFICIGIQLVYTLFFIKTAAKQAPIQSKDLLLEWHSVSLIICAKNEAENLNVFLPKIVALQYPKHLLEIIIVDDGSTDDTGKVVKEYSDLYDFIKVIHLSASQERNLPGKKFALKTAVSKAQNEWILLTDADCVPNNNSWIQGMIQSATVQNCDVLLGYGAYQSGNGFLNGFIQFETLHTAMQYFSYADQGLAYMGVGRNLLYRSAVLKSAFEDEYLLEKMRKTASGDDDLVIANLSKKYRIASALHGNSFTISQSVSDWKSYFKQKTRHTSSSKYYPSIIKFSLGVYAFTHLGFWIVGLIWAAMVGINGILPFFYLVVTGVAGLLILKFFNFYLWQQKLKNSMHPINLLFLDFFWCIYNVILSPYIFWKNKQKWN